MDYPFGMVKPPIPGRLEHGEAGDETGGETGRPCYRPPALEFCGSRAIGNGWFRRWTIKPSLDPPASFPCDWPSAPVAPRG